MFLIVACALITAYLVWVLFRAWRYGLITVRSFTYDRRKQPAAFRSNLILMCLVAATVWFGMSVIIYRGLH